MKFDPMDIKTIKRFLKQVDGEMFRISRVSELLDQETEYAQAYILALENLGYVQKGPIVDTWVISVRGQILIHRKGNRIFRPKSMKKALLKFLERVEYVNSSDVYIHRVTVVKVRSQYPIKESSEGIKVVYELKKLELDDEEMHRRDENLRDQKNGNFDNKVADMFYPETAVRLFLKSRSQIIKLRQLYDREIDLIGGNMVYDFCRDE